MPMSFRPICRVSQRRDLELPRGEEARQVGTEISVHVYPRLSSVLVLEFVLLDLALISLRCQDQARPITAWPFLDPLNSSTLYPVV